MGLRKAMNRRSHFLATTAKQWGIQVANAVEIGVLYGSFAKCLRARWPTARLTLVDVWRHMPEMAEAKGRLHMMGGSAEANAVFWEETYARVRAMFAADGNVSIIRSLSVPAAERFANDTFDVVHIDGDHRYAGVVADIKAWLPKVRRGAMLCGHDYTKSSPRRFLMQVKAAVDDTLGADNIVVGANTTWAYRKL